MRPRGHPPPPRDKGKSSLRRHFALGALCFAPLLFCGCSAASSTWTRLINQFNLSSETNSAPSPSAAESSSRANPNAALEEEAAPTPIPKKKAHASATQRSAPEAASTNVEMAEPQLQDAPSASVNYQISRAETGVGPSGSGGARAGEPGAPSAETRAANVSPTIALGAHAESPPLRLAESRSAPTTGKRDTSSRAAAPTSSATPVNESIQAKAERMIRAVKATAKEIDQSRLSTSDTSRYSLATKMIRSAEKTMTEYDYAAAASLAKKAIDLLAPLPRRPESKSVHR
jgi:hypothetical protein